MSSLGGFIRNQAGKALSGSSLTEALQTAALDGGIREHGWTVAGGLGLDSMAVNLAFLAMSKATDAAMGSGGGTAKNAGMFFAAQGGNLKRGLFVWNTGGKGKLGLNRFTFPMNPESLSESLSPEWAETKVPGQNRPMYQFINGGPREVSFTLNFWYMDRKRQVIRDQINALKSLTQRPYTGNLGGAYSGPPAIRFFFGDYIRGEQFIVSKLAIKSFDLFDPRSLLPLRADVDITLLEVADTSGVRSVGKTNNVILR